MRMILLLLTGWILFGFNITESNVECKQTIETLKQTIEVKEMSNRILREMVRKRDSIIYIQDSTIVALKNHIH